MKYLFIFIAVCILNVGLTAVAQASSYTVTPPVIDMTVEPRDLSSAEITVTNNSPQKLRLFPTVVRFDMDDDGQMVPGQSRSTTDQSVDSTSWIAINMGRFEIDPFSSATIPASFQISHLAKPGTYHAMISFPKGKNRPEAEVLTYAGQAPGVMVTFRILDTKNELLQLRQFFTERFVTNQTNREITITLENSGDTPLSPTGLVLFYNTRGVEVGSVPITGTVTLDPGETQTIQVTPPDMISFGRYKAFLKVDYGANQRASLYDTTFFTVVPVFWLVIIFGFLLSITGLLAWLYHRSAERVVYSTDEADEVTMIVRPHTSSTPRDHDITLT